MGLFKNREEGGGLFKKREGGGGLFKRREDGSGILFNRKQKESTTPATPKSEVKKQDEVKPQPLKKEGLSTTTIIVIGIGAVVVIGGIILIATRKN
jgi:hypothetical protein